MTLPTFVVLGPPRTATTWLFTCLSANPNVGLSSLKEVRFFDERFEKGLSWYEHQFAEVGAGRKAIGDITPGYFSHPETPDRMLDVFGKNVDLFIIERDPVERAFSEYRGMLRRDETGDSFQDALLSCPRLIENSSYAKQTERFMTRFNPDRIHLISYDEIASQPEMVIQKVCEILGVDSVKSSSLHNRVNEGTAPPKYRGFRQAISKFRSGIEATKVGRKLLWTARRIGLVSRFHRATSSNDSLRQQLNDADRRVAAELLETDQQRWQKLRQQFLHGN